MNIKFDEPAPNLTKQLNTNADLLVLDSKLKKNEIKIRLAKQGLKTSKLYSGARSITTPRLCVLDSTDYASLFSKLTMTKVQVR